MKEKLEIRNWKFVFLFSIFYYLFSSCEPKPDYSAEISQLDSAGALTEEAEKILFSSDTHSLRTAYNSTAQNLNNIIQKLAGDTVKKKMGIFLTDAFQQSGNIINLLDMSDYLKKSVTESEQRIKNLKHDLLKNLIEQDRVREYVEHEIVASKKIHGLVTNSVARAKLSAAKLDSLKTKIIALADSLSDDTKNTK